MTDEQKRKYNTMVEKINNMSKEELKKLIASNQCPYEPEHLIGVPMGMHHCGVCGSMVVAGLPHPR